MPSDHGPTMVAIRARVPLEIDGKLRASTWKDCRPYTFALPQSEIATHRKLEEGGEVRLAWDEHCFYVGLRLTDSDVVAEGETSQLMHNGLGDVCEVLLKPERQTWYWEFHVTPVGQKATFFFPGRGRLGLPSCIANTYPVRTAARVEGDLNDWRTRDQGWTAEMAIPLSVLSAHGDVFAPGEPWRILIGRYNYSRFLTTRGPELSTSPQISRPDFHRHEEYAKLELQQ